MFRGYLINNSDNFLFSLCWLLILLHHVQKGFFSISSHVFPISAGFQLILFPGVGGPAPSPPSVCRPVPGSSGSMQATAHFFVWHSIVYFLIQCKNNRKKGAGKKELISNRLLSL
jgi:hypothetical protein